MTRNDTENIKYPAFSPTTNAPIAGLTAKFIDNFPLCRGRNSLQLSFTFRESKWFSTDLPFIADITTGDKNNLHRRVSHFPSGRISLTFLICLPTVSWKWRDFALDIVLFQFYVFFCVVFSCVVLKHSGKCFTICLFPDLLFSSHQSIPIVGLNLFSHAIPNDDVISFRSVNNTFSVRCFYVQYLPVFSPGFYFIFVHILVPGFHIFNLGFFHLLGSRF